MTPLPTAAAGSGASEGTTATPADAAAALDELLARHGAAVRRLASLFERSKADRDDLVQDIWLAVWRAWPRFRAECAERTFVLRIAHNRAVSYVCGRAPQHHDLEAAAQVADGAAGPERRVASSQEAQRLLEGLRSLSLVSRQVMSLSLEGLAQREIAEVLGTSESNVAVRLHRARAQLRNVLEDAP